MELYGIFDGSFWEKVSGSNMLPWSSWHEWNLVRDSLFSSSPAAALNRIRAWRGKGCLPPVVDITASIVEIHQTDPFFNLAEHRVGDGSLSQEMMSMLYCMAIIRLVNCVIERTRKRNGKSIAEAAEEIRIPRMLIDIRHEGSHRDLPSLELLRLASVEAIEWLKTYYWNPQRDAVHCEDENMDAQKEIESKINELAYLLTTKDTPTKSSSSIDIKRPKKQISKALKNLRRLYLSFPCAVVDVLLNFMTTHYNSSMSIELIAGAQTTSERSLQSLFDDWEPAILKLSKKDANFIFTFLEAVLSKIQGHYSEEHYIDDSISSLQTGREFIPQVHVLSALFAWLVRILQNMKSLMDESSVVEPQDTSEMLTPRYRIRKLLRTCLHVATPDNGQLTRSSVVLAQMTANGSLSQKLKKLLKHGSFGGTCFTNSNSEYTLEQQESDIRRAATEFELVKCSKLKIQTFHEPQVADFGSDSKWGMAESWNQCVIGMLPFGFGSLNNPISATNDLKAVKALNSNEALEPMPCSCKRKFIDEDSNTVQNTVLKKMKETTEDHESHDMFNAIDENVHGTCGGVKGLMLLDGAWKRIGDEEINAIRSSVRILGR